VCVPNKTLSQKASRCSGFTLIELAISLAITGVMAYVVNTTILTMYRASGTTTREIDLTESLRVTMRPVSDELRSASRTGEDGNGNKTLEADEDRNGNGRLDADWNLTATSLRFNRYVGDGKYSLPITYRLNNGRIERVQMMDVTGRSITTSIARGVTSFKITDASPRVTIELEVDRSKSGSTMRQAVSLSILPRN
jgi:prepilin-type N-terminal cleavage/methylation domain-containing protein